MRYLTFSLQDDPIPRLGVLHSDDIVDVRSLSGRSGSGPLPETVPELIGGGAAAWRRLADLLGRELPKADGARYRAGEIRWHAYSEYCHTAAARRSSWTRRRML